MSKGKIITTNLNVRFRDLDALGHVNNAVFLPILNRAESIFFDRFFRFQNLQILI